MKKIFPSSKLPLFVATACAVVITLSSAMDPDPGSGTLISEIVVWLLFITFPFSIGILAFISEIRRRESDYVMDLYYLVKLLLFDSRTMFAISTISLFFYFLIKWKFFDIDPWNVFGLFMVPAFLYGTFLWAIESLHFYISKKRRNKIAQ